MRTLMVALVLAGALRAQLPVGFTFRPLQVSPAGIIVNDLGHPVILRGLNRSATGSGNADANSTSQDYAAQNQLLSMNLVRIFVNAAWWNNNVQVPIANLGYQAYIDQLIQWAEQHGNYVLILKDEQFTTPPCGADGVNCTTPQSGDLSCPNPPGCAADTTGNFTQTALTFWAAFAKQYAANPAVLYGTWEDMHNIDNATWSADQNALIAAIRNNNPQALIFVQDIDANQTFESIVAGTLPDLAWPNLVWDFHLFDGSSGSCSEPTSRRAVNWPQNIDPLVIYAHQQGHAAGVMEWGGCNGNPAFDPEISSYAQIRSMPLAYFDNTDLIVQNGGAYQLTTIGSQLAPAYTALGSGAALSGNQLTPLAHAVDAPSFTTTLILTNAGTVPALYAQRFFDQGGSLLSPVALASGSLDGSIPAGESATIHTAGTGDYLGWGELAASTSVSGFAIYSQKNQLPSIQEGTATLTPGGNQHFFVPFDNTQGAVTSMALTNPGTTTTLLVTLRYSDGTTETPAFGPLSAGNHQSFAFPTEFPNTSGRSGVAEFVSSVPLYTVAFRFNSTGAFTALDVVPAGDAASSITHTLPHAVDASSFQTTVLLTNTATSAATYLLQFNDEQGNPPSPPVALQTGALTGTIPAGGSATIRTAGTGSYLGWAQLTAPASVGGSVIYSQKNQLPSIQEGTATIMSSGTQHFFLPFDNTGGAVASMALTNPGTAAANITLTLRFSDGTSATPAFPALPARSHLSVPILPNAANQAGVAEFVSSVPVNGVAFRFNPTGAFTAFEIVPQ